MHGDEGSDERNQRDALPSIREIARRERWVVTTSGLADEGVSRARQSRANAPGYLTTMYRGVHLYGRTDPTRDERDRAALLAAGPDAVLSHRSAAARWGLRRWRGDVEVIVPTRRRRRRGLHPRTRLLHPRDITMKDGLPITTLARTLVDLASLLDEAALDHAVQEADVLGKLRVEAVDAAMARAPGARGLPRLRAALVRRRPVDGPLRDVFERRFHGFLRDRDYPPSRHNVPFDLGRGVWATVDVVFEEAWLAIELDGGSHLTPAKYAADRRRDRRLMSVHRLPVSRVTWFELTEEPDALDEDLKAQLASRNR